MSYPIQPYNPNQLVPMDRPIARPMQGGSPNLINAEELIGSLFGVATQLMSEILRNGPGDLMGLMAMSPMNPGVGMFGVSSMNMMQITRGPDGRPHIVQAHDERRIGPGGVIQTRRALRDPERGINKMEIGYFVGDHAEIVERRLEPSNQQFQGQAPPQIQSSYSHPLPRPNQPSRPEPALYMQQAPYSSSHRMQPQPALPAPNHYRYR